jgi:hypothetical protein
VSAALQASLRKWVLLLATFRADRTVLVPSNIY